MVKKINRDEIATKRADGKRNETIRNLKNIKSKEIKINYWAKKELNESQPKKNSMVSIWKELRDGQFIKQQTEVVPE